MRAFAVLFCLFASSLAYQVTRPSTNQGWNNDGGQILTWDRVSSDRLNFTAVLTHQATSEMQILAALVDGNLRNASMNPPSGGWPTGSGFRVRLVTDSQNLTSILAESQVFDIKDIPLTLRTATSTAAINTPTNNVNNNNAPTQTDDQPIPIPTKGAASALTVQTSLAAFLFVLGIALV